MCYKVSFSKIRLATLTVLAFRISVNRESYQVARKILTYKKCNQSYRNHDKVEVIYHDDQIPPWQVKKL